jgi:hypothetical protein
VKSVLNFSDLRIKFLERNVKEKELESSPNQSVVVVGDFGLWFASEMALFILTY